MRTDTFSYNKNKVIQALRYHFVSRKEIKFIMIAVNVFAIISAILFFTKVISPLAFLVSSLLWFGLMASFWFFLPRAIYKRTQMFKDRFSASVTPAGLTLENDRGSKHWDWNEFESMMESPHFFHLYFNSRAFFVLPKEAFVGDMEHDARKMMQENIGK